MKCFDWFYPRLLKFEGGLRVVRLKGEEDITVAGIYRKWNKQWEGWNHLDDPVLLEKLVRQYYEDLWKKSGVWRLPCPVAIITFNGIVATGIHRGSKFLQKCCPKYVRRDGIIGQQTANCINQKDWLKVAFCYTTNLSMFEVSLTGKELYYRGWIRRNLKLLQEVIENAKTLQSIGQSELEL